MLGGFLPILATSRSQSAKESQGEKDIVISRDKRRVEVRCLGEYSYGCSKVSDFERGACGCGPFWALAQSRGKRILSFRGSSIIT